MTGIEGFLTPFINWELILYIAAGVFVGIYVGAIPGLSVTMAVAILISFTFSWPLMPAIAVMVGVFVGGVYGGSRASILLNIPGAPSAFAATFDGFPMAQKGEAGIAMGICTTECVIGAIFGIIILATLSPLISLIALKFTPMHFFILGIMGLLLIGSLAKGSMLKALATAFIGVMIGLVGMDPIIGQGRLTFGINSLMGGISFVVVMIAIFGVSEAMLQLRHNVTPVKQEIDKIIPSRKVVIKHMPLALRSGALGVFIGALPGTGGDIASLIAYDQAKRTVKNPSRPFGQGAIEGLIAPEASASACIGGAFIPMMTLGIPGDSVTAIMIGAMIIHGVRPGPLLMQEQPEIFFTMLGCLLIAVIFLYIFGMQGIKLFSKIVEIPKAIIIPIIIVLTIIGSYSINNSIEDIYWMVGFGIFGYLLKMYDYPVAPMVLGVILSSIIEINWRRSMEMMESNITAFIQYLFTNPISLLLIALIVVMMVSQSNWWKNRSKETAIANKNISAD